MGQPVRNEPPPPVDHQPVRYEPPRLRAIGSVHDLTLHGGGKCWRGKKWGGSDGLEWMGIDIPVSSC